MQLPHGWSSCSLSDIAAVNPKTVADESLIAGFVPMSYAPTSYHGELQFDEKPWGEIKKSYTNFQDGDVIFAKVTPCFENGKAAIVDDLPNGIGAGSSEFYVLRPHCNDISQKLLFALIKTHAFMQEGATNMTGAVGLRRVPKSFVETFPIALPPAAEQKEIADRLDILLAQVEATQARLARIPDIIKRFRQSVLVAAVSGNLTEEWRSGCQFNTTSEELGKLAKFIDYRGKTPNKTDSGIPLITAKNIRQGFISREPREFIAKEDYESWMTRGIPNHGDVLITTEAPMGYVANVDIKDKFALAQRAICFQFQEDINPYFASIYMQSSEFQKKLDENATGSTVKGIKAALLKKIQVTFPIKDEQTEIVRRVEQLFAYADSIEQQAKAAKTRVDKLTQAMLAKAFRGELTADWRAANPDLISGDHSAAALLARIQAERATAKPRKRATKTSAT